MILKQYVEAHWTVNAEKYRDPETTEAVRANFKEVYHCVQPFEYIKSEFSLVTVDSHKHRRREQPEGSEHSSPKNFEILML